MGRPADRPSGSESDAEMKITMRRDTWTALLAAVVRVRPSGSVGPRSDRTGVEAVAASGMDRNGEEGGVKRGGKRGGGGGEGGERRPTRGGSVAARVVAGSGVAGFGGWQPGWKHANDPLIPSRDIGPLTHASAGDPSGAASNMPSQLFDSTNTISASLSFSRFLSISVCLSCPATFFPRLSSSPPPSLFLSILLDFLPLSPFSIGHAFLLRIYLVPFPIQCFSLSLADVSCSFFRLHRRISCLPPFFHFPLLFARFIPVVITLSRSLPSSGLACTTVAAQLCGFKSHGIA